MSISRPSDRPAGERFETNRLSESLVITTHPIKRNEHVRTAIKPYLFFSGRCEEALEFYRTRLGVEIDTIVRFSESPEPTPPGMLQAGFENKIMHASFRVRGVPILASDGCGDAGTFDGFRLALSLPTEADARQAFGALADGGSVQLPLLKTFWSPCFGMLTDRFNIRVDGHDRGAFELNRAGRTPPQSAGLRPVDFKSNSSRRKLCDSSPDTPNPNPGRRALHAPKREVPACRVTLTIKEIHVMNVVIFVKATKQSEAGALPSEELLAAMGKYNEELVNAEIMLSGEGLKPGSQGARVRFTGTDRFVTDRPFAETDEVIAGFWMWEVKSTGKAIDWVKRCPNPMMENSNVEIHPVFKPDDLGQGGAWRPRRPWSESGEGKP